VSERPKEIKIKAYKTNIRISYPTLASIADPMEKKHFTTMMICADSLMKLKRYDDANIALEILIKHLDHFERQCDKIPLV
jgi:hypothetical protein